MNKFFVKKRNLLDARDVSWIEILQHSLVNFLFGFTSGFVIALVSLFRENTTIYPALVLAIVFFGHKQVESKILNRNKYITKLGRNYIFPIPSTIGFILGVWLTTLF